MVRTMPPNSDPQMKFTQNPVIYDNRPAAIIVIYPDTLKNELRDFEDSIKNKGDLILDLGLVGSFLGTLLTVAEFKDFFGINGSTWHAVFLVLLVLSIYKFLKNCFYSFVKKVTHQDIIDRLLDESRKKKSH